MKKVFVTFAGGSDSYRQSVVRLRQEVMKTGLFDAVHGITDQDLLTAPQHQPFQQQHGAFIANHARGYGYWLWKPYLVRELLSHLDEGDILLYADAGCEVSIRADAMEQLLSYVRGNGAAFYFSGHDHYSHTKMDLLQHFDILREQFEQEMCAATLFGLQKNEKSLRWLMPGGPWQQQIRIIILMTRHQSCRIMPALSITDMTSRFCRCWCMSAACSVAIRH